MSDNRNLVMTRDQVKQVTGDNHQRIKEFEKLLGRLSSDPVEPITVAITGNTTYTLANDRGTQTILIPEAMLKASAGGPFTLTITTGVGDSVVIPIAASGDTILSGDLLFDIYIDSSGNVISKSWTIKGQNVRGGYEMNNTKALYQYNWDFINGNGTAINSKTVTYPINFFGLPLDHTQTLLGFTGANPTAINDTTALASTDAPLAKIIDNSSFTAGFISPVARAASFRMVWSWHAEGYWA